MTIPEPPHGDHIAELLEDDCGAVKVDVQDAISITPGPLKIIALITFPPCLTRLLAVHHSTTKEAIMGGRVRRGIGRDPRARAACASRRGSDGWHWQSR